MAQAEGQFQAPASLLPRLKGTHAAMSPVPGHLSCWAVSLLLTSAWIRISTTVTQRKPLRHPCSLSSSWTRLTVLVEGPPAGGTGRPHPCLPWRATSFPELPLNPKASVYMGLVVSTYTRVLGPVVFCLLSVNPQLSPPNAGPSF